MNAPTHPPFISRSQKGRHHAPVRASIRSEIPKTKKATVKNAKTRRNGPRARKPCVSSTIVTTNHNPASIRLPFLSNSLMERGERLTSKLSDVRRKRRLSVNGTIRFHQSVERTSGAHVRWSALVELSMNDHDSLFLGWRSVVCYCSAVIIERCLRANCICRILSRKMRDRNRAN